MIYWFAPKGEIKSDSKSLGIREVFIIGIINQSGWFVFVGDVGGEPFSSFFFLNSFLIPSLTTFQKSKTNEFNINKMCLNCVEQ